MDNTDISSQLERRNFEADDGRQKEEAEINRDEIILR